jgi:fructose-1,6-bisphosphatase
MNPQKGLWHMSIRDGLENRETEGGNMLQTAIEAAQQAGQTILERYPGERKLTVKGYRDLVTDADIAAQEIILKLIQARFSDHTIVSEEARGGEISSGYTWVVDPLDGTTNSRRPEAGKSAAVIHGLWIRWTGRPTTHTITLSSPFLSGC